MDIKAECATLRAQILDFEKRLRAFKGELPHVEFGQASFGTPVENGTIVPDRGEMIANAMLAYRHLEDARMRIGKVIQAFDGGASCYPI
jgi:hypothetical protein